MYKTRQEAITALSEKLHEYIADTDTLVLLSGGSSIAASVAALAQLPAADLAHITVGLTDERFGVYHHPDSNAKALSEAGLMNLGIKDFYQVLSEENLSFEECIAGYNTTLQDLLSQFSKSIGIFGIGADKHIAGILPHSIAAQEQTEIVVGYKADPYMRITMTFPAIRHLQNAFIYAEGEGKRNAIESLKETVPVSEHPNQIVKQLPEHSVFYCEESLK